MPIKTRTEIKAFFESGDIPTELEFIDTFDSVFFKDEGIAVSSDFSGDGQSGTPITPVKATLQATLSVDDLITLSGVADGAVNLGTFTGVTIPNSQTIKAALQALETALEAATGSASYDSLTSGTVTAAVRRFGGSAVSISNPGSGEYTLTVPSGADLMGAQVFGNNTTLNGSNEFLIRVDNSANSRDRRVTAQVYDASTGSLVNQFSTSTNHTQTVSANVSLLTFPGMNLFGVSGFYIILS